MKQEKKFRFAMSRDGIIAYDKETPMTIRFTPEESNEMTKRIYDYESMDYYCEVAHLEISNACNMNCSYCYTGEKKKDELTTIEWRMIIDNLAKGGIFQVSFGGGEPTLRKDLFLLANHVRASGMNLGMTTNGMTLPGMADDEKRALKAYFKQINVSWHQNLEIVEQALKVLKDFDIPRGINYAFSRSMQDDNETVKSLAKEYDAELLYLVYKPIDLDFNEQVPADIVKDYAQKAANDKVKVAVDGPCVGQCLAGKKFVDIDSKGNCFQCSFVRESIGNLLENDFAKIWKERRDTIKCPYVTITGE